jgi:hypothetical protein
LVFQQALVTLIREIHYHQANSQSLACPVVV